MPKRRLTGTIVSNKMSKTIVVRVERIKEHSKYRKRFKVHKNYKAHAPEGEFKVGEKVTIEECRPISRDKRWQVVKKVFVT
ncbi:MAG: 30S ribosomal protein S17 [Candidatus Nealsonbacteria bacterium CG09_land_8_20_14_0_10_42_14]|uniref:Small ribosomal subunit protein uS17 n=1 Tax=Candidatus Nealsonbacteria bacterium CG09_land_8_20_14_0_10_42_14 TaxID=1974707 RepID=A0A2H0WXN5_9BACT|nr:MAG: 30S ribosomal protein S17 [Candidatus Nealsonbacteria bacterium CG09_land_8_20_14_0_10_42_14]